MIDLTYPERPDRSAAVPWWLGGIILLLLGAAYLIITQPELYAAYKYIRSGLPATLGVGLSAGCLALLLGLPIGLAANDRRTWLRQAALFYLALIGGIPSLVMLFLVAFVVWPWWARMTGHPGNPPPMAFRATLALGLAYSATAADLIRALGQSGLPIGRSPLPRRQIILISGFVFIATLKDSSLISVLALLDLTGRTRTYIGSTLHFPAAILTAVILYLALTAVARYLFERFDQAQ